MLLYILGGAAVAFLYFKNGQSKQPLLPFGTQKGAQPKRVSTTYPYKNPVSKRVDNAPQPWYTGAAGSALKIAKDSGLMQQAASALPSGASIIHSLGDIFGPSSSKSGTPKAFSADPTLMDADSFNQKLDETLTGSGFGSDNTMGEESDDAFNLNEEDSGTNAEFSLGGDWDNSSGNSDSSSFDLGDFEF